ncbi:MAG: hypothetical protein ACREMZ_08170 [Gemmatimonadales bacterium]
MARNAFALAFLTAMALSGCSKLDQLPFLGNKKAKEAEANLAAQRARTDSLRKVRRIADSVAVVRHAACVDSIRAELSKPAVAKKTRGKARKRAPAPSPELIATQAQTICEQRSQPPQATVAAKPAAPGAKADSVKALPAIAKAAPDSARPVATAVRDSAPRTVAMKTAGRAGTTVQPPLDQSAWADSVRKARETEMSRETFAYSGGTRDPFNSLLNMAKAGPELADLQLVGIYRNMRLPSGSVAVFREREGGKRHRLRAGDQVGRSRLVQIRERDVVFMIEDFGFERQETLSLRKQEDVTP